MYKIFLLLVLVLFIFIGCSENKNSAIVTHDISGLAVDSDHVIVIEESKLGQQFLLVTTSTPQLKSLEFEDSKSRVVMFEIHNGLLYMLESPQGHISDADLENDIVLAEFPINKQSDGKIYFDFNVGMKSLYNMLPSAWASDFDGTEYTSQTFDNQNLNIGYVKSVEQNSSTGRLWLKQVVQTNGDKGESQLSVDYYLSTYDNNSSFVPTQSPGFDKTGYFETYPQLTEHGVTKRYANKFNLSKGAVTYAISSNTPQKYRQAIRDGVEYWNNVLGETLVKVIDAPEGIQAPHPEYNIIQWQDDVTAQYAYASFNDNPLTGELLHAQIYLPSSWVDVAFHDSTYEINLQQDINSSEKICKINIGKHYYQNMLQLHSIGAKPLEIQNMVQDLLTYVVSHEVGHTLGLRHNFGGSTVHEYHEQNNTQLYSEYLKTLDDDDTTEPSDLFKSVVVTSSTMDYPDEIGDFIIGYQITRGESFSYDKAAIRYLYKGEEPQVWPFFCTDSEVGAFADCQIFDGKQALVHNLEKYNKYINLLPYSIFNEFINTKESSEWESGGALEEVMLNISALPYIELRNNVLELFSSTHYLQPLKGLYPGYSGSELHRFLENMYLDNNLILELNRDSLRQQFQEILKTDDINAREISSILKPIEPKRLILQWKNDFDQLLVSKSSGEGLYEDYKFTKEEQTIIQEKAYKLFERLGYELVVNDSSYLSRSSIHILDGVLGEGLLYTLKEMEKSYLFLTQDTAEPLRVQYGANNVYATVELPQFALNWLERSDISMLLSSDRVSMLDSLKGWGKQERIEVCEYYENYFNTLLEPLITHLKAQSFDSDEVIEFFDKSDSAANEWYLEVLTVYGTLYEEDS